MILSTALQRWGGPRRRRLCSYTPFHNSLLTATTWVSSIGYHFKEGLAPLLQPLSRWLTTPICISITLNWNHVYGPICIRVLSVVIVQVAEMDVLYITVAGILHLMGGGKGGGLLIF